MQRMIPTKPRSVVSRQAWLDASHFHSHGMTEVLSEVAKRVRSARESRPLILLDLDSTLYEVGHRSLQIFREWTQTPDAAKFPVIRDRLGALPVNQLGYSLKDTFSAMGLSPANPAIHAAREMLSAFWQKRFFTNEYLKYDHVYPGAARFARELHDLGAEIIYLTGRDEPGMGIGTRENLVRDGFPWKRERTHLLLKPRFEDDDLAHKLNAAEFIRKTGTLVASFENEPANLVALYDAFPEAMHVFVETVWSDREVVPGRNLYRISGFAE
jgi:hypothetical protein